MSVASVYVRVKYSNERYKSFAYRIHPSHVQLIYVHGGLDCAEMAPKDRKGSDIEEVKKPKVAKSDAKAASVEGHEKKKKSWKEVLPKVVYITVAVIAIIIAIVVIVLSLMAIIITQLYTTDQSGRIAGLIIVNISGFVTIIALIYASVAVVKRKLKQLFVVTLILVAVVVIQAVIAGTVVHLTPKDLNELTMSLSNLFGQSRTFDVKAIKQYHVAETSLQCCGLNGPEDYRTVYINHDFPPDVPVSCCPAYEVDRSDIVQEKVREICRQTRSYYKTGCKEIAIEYEGGAYDMLLHVLIVVIIFECVLIVLGILAHVFSNKLKVKAHETQKA